MHEYKKVSNLGKFYFLPKTHKRSHIVPGRPVVSNCRTTKEKASKFLDYHLKYIMQTRKYYIKDSGDFISKIKTYKTLQRVQFLLQWM